jgi:hypothetical protein
MSCTKNRPVRWCLSALVAVSASGCSLIGLSIGAATPLYRAEASGSVPSVASCRDVQLEFTRAPKDKYKVRAQLEQADATGLRLRLSDGQLVTSSWSQITEVSCRDGSYALTGLAVGLALDLIATVAVVTTMPKMPSLK